MAWFYLRGGEGGRSGDEVADGGSSSSSLSPLPSPSAGHAAAPGVPAAVVDTFSMALAAQAAPRQ